MAGGINTYAYAYQNAINYYDPDGNRPTKNPKGPNGKAYSSNYTQTLNFQMGSTILTPNKNGVKSAQTTGIGVGIYVQVCPKPDPCEKGNKADLTPDAASATFKSLMGASINENGVCFAIGPVLSLPGLEFDTTSKHE